MKGLLYLLIAAIVAIGVLGCGKGGGITAVKDEHAGEEPGAHAGEEEGAHAEDIVLTADAAKIAGIEIGEARMMPMQGELKVPGAVTNTTQGRALVTPPVAGKITRIHVKVGDNLRAGQPIATLQSAELAEAWAGIIEAQRGVIAAQASATEAKSQIDLANARLRTAQQTLRRQQEFAKTGAFSQPALQAAQKDLADAESELERGKQDQAVHQAQLERAERLYKQELISRTELEQARLEVETDKIRQRNAERRIELAKATFEREQRIAQQNLTNSREIQAAEAEVRTANLEVQQAKIRHRAAIAGIAGANKRLQAARASYSAQSGGSRGSGGGLTVVAPIGGVVRDIEATLGQAVERTDEICQVENLRSVWVIAQVPEKSVALARRGSRAQVTVSAYPGRVFAGVVQVVGSRLDPKSRTMPVQVLVDNRGGALRADMFATVALGVGGSNMALAVPRSAIVEQGDRRLVYVLESAAAAGGEPHAEPGHKEEGHAEEEMRFEEKVVELGRVQGDWVEVLSGLEPGARIVTKGGFVLKSEKVKGELKGHEH